MQTLAEKLIDFSIRQINEVGENFGWQIGKISANYENGYMQSTRDCKVQFRKKEVLKGIEEIVQDHIVEANKIADQFREDTKKVVTNADRIRNMSDEELRDFLFEIITENPCRICSFKTGWICEVTYEGSCHDGVMKWLKEKVEQ